MAIDCKDGFEKNHRIKPIVFSWRPGDLTTDFTRLGTPDVELLGMTQHCPPALGYPHWVIRTGLSAEPSNSNRLWRRWSMGLSLNLWQGVSQADGGDNYRYPEDNDDIGEFASLHPREHIIDDVQRSKQTE